MKSNIFITVISSLKLLKASIGLGIIIYLMLTFGLVLFTTSFSSLYTFLSNWIAFIAHGLFHDIWFLRIVVFNYLLFLSLKILTTISIKKSKKL